jgi:uroporphyrinogen decarboxylase
VPRAFGARGNEGGYRRIPNQWPDPWSEREEHWVASQLTEARNAQKAVFGGLPQLNSSFFEIGHTMFGYERFMELLLENRNVVERWLDRILEHAFEILGRYLAIVGSELDVIAMTDDFGGQESLQIAPAMCREIFKPRQRQWIDFVKARAPAKVFLHSDGAIDDIIPDLIEVGIDILNPIQASAKK